MVFPKPEETAVLIVNGSKYSEWESVSVRWAMREHPFIQFRFTCSEGMPISKNFAALQIVPGMDCNVTLAGFPAVDGQVSTRQVFTDARRHHIEIQGASETMGIAQASVVTKTGEFKDCTYEKYAKELLKPFPAIKFLVEGGQLPDMKFPRISIPPGTSVLEALEIPLRSLGGIELTSNPKGDLVACVGPSGGGSDTIYEGDLGRPSFLEGREIIFNPGMAKGTFGIGSAPGNDQEHGAKANLKFQGEMFDSVAPKYAPQVVPLEIPAWTDKHLKGRVTAGKDWQQRDEVTVFVTVQGWLKPSGGLWKHNEMVTVISPMLILDGSLPLRIKSVTFTQDDKTGTRTVIEMMNERALAGFNPQSGEN